MDISLRENCNDFPNSDSDPLGSCCGYHDDPAWLITPDALNAPHIKNRLKQPRRQLDPYALYISSHISLEGPYIEPSPSPSPTATPRAQSPVNHRPTCSQGNPQLPTPSSLEALSRSSTWTTGRDFTTDRRSTSNPLKVAHSQSSIGTKRRTGLKNNNKKKKLRRCNVPDAKITKSTRTRNTHSMLTRSKGAVARQVFR